MHFNNSNHIFVYCFFFHVTPFLHTEETPYPPSSECVPVYKHVSISSA